VNLSCDYSRLPLERLASAQTLEISVREDAPEHPLALDHESIVDHTRSHKLTHDKVAIAKLLALSDGH
jgi:hypothetical protein